MLAPVIARGQRLWARVLSARKGNLSKRECLFYVKLPGGNVRCELCPRKCVVPPGSRGYCRVRENDSGKYYSLVYSRPCTAHIDPIEKKPFFHFLPGTSAFSLATVGCNMHCKFCQNWEISQPRPEEVQSFKLSPQECVQLAKENLCPSIALTYTEPIVFYEYTLDIARASRGSGVKTVVVSAGYINQKPLEKLLQRLDAIKIDLKSFSDDYYRRICGTRLEPVLETLKVIRQSGVWFEIVNLIEPTLNDSDEEHKRMFEWIIKNLGDSVPVHITRFYPMYLLKNLPPTPVSTLRRLYDLAKKVGLKFPYIGNVPGDPGESTYCPKCGKMLVHRRGFGVGNIQIENSRCKFCGEYIPGIWTQAEAQSKKVKVG